MRNSADQPVHGSSGSRAGVDSPLESPIQPALVPPVSGFLQAIKRQREKLTETPRSDEVFWSPRTAQSQMEGSTTARSSLGGEFSTPRETPRTDPEEGGGGKLEEVSYEGPLVGGLKHGHGTLRSAGSTYNGQFEHDRKHGQGTLLWNDGRCYSGQFEQGKFHGVAVMTWPDGRTFDGQYARDRKHGEGIFSWSDGRRYQGQWVCGKRQGVGVYTNAKSITRRGWWQNDRPLHWDPVDDTQASTAPSGTIKAPIRLMPPLKEPPPVMEPQQLEVENEGAQDAPVRSLTPEHPPSLRAPSPASETTGFTGRMVVAEA